MPLVGAYQSKARLGRFHQKVIMIGHQAVGTADPVVATNYPGLRVKQLERGIGEKHFLAHVRRLVR